MKYKFYCAINEDVHVIDFLRTRKIKYEDDPISKRIYFTIYSDTEGSSNLLTYIQTLPEALISKSSVFSKQELEDANWYLLYVTRMGIETKNTSYTYEAKCPYVTQYGMKKSKHLDQINPFVSSKTPKWKNGYNFCSTETGFMTQIFCSDLAKNVIRNSQVTGVDFIPVLKKDLKTETPDVNQLIFTNKLPLEAFTFIGKYHEDICQSCGRINYIFEELNCDNIRLNVDVIPKNIDAFGSEIIVGWGFGEELIVISKKLYNILLKELKENPKHFIIYPIA